MGTARFFDDDGMDFAVRCVLSGVRHGMAEVGEVFAVSETIRDGDPRSWLEAYLGLGRRLRTEADIAASAGHRHSAWNAALRATNYLFAALWWAPATPDAAQATQWWDEHRQAWDLAVDHWPSPAVQVRVPCGSTTLPGYWFHSAVPRGERSPVVVMVQGLNTPVSDACMTGMDGALQRGYHVLLVDGPGQGAALHRQALTLDDSRPGSLTGSTVLRSSLEWLATRPEVDEDRIAVIGVDQGSFLALSSVAGLSADPHPADPHTADRHMPAALVLDPELLDLGATTRAAVAQAGADRMQLALLRGTTTEPTGTDSVPEALTVLDRYRLEHAQLAAITCPIAVVRAEDASPPLDPSATLLGATDGEVHEIRLTHAEGAGAECGLDASQIHDAKVFDWLDDRFARCS